MNEIFLLKYAIINSLNGGFSLYKHECLNLHVSISNLMKTIEAVQIKKWFN